MHICFLCDEYPPGRHGGAGSLTQTLARALVAGGRHVTVAGVYPIDRMVRDEDEGVVVIRLPQAGVRGASSIVNGLKLVRELKELNRQIPIDVIDGPELSFANINLNGQATKIIRMNGGYHFTATVPGRRQSIWMSWREKRSFERANDLCAVSEFVAETTRDLLNLGNRPIEILPGPVDTERFKPRPEFQEEDGLIIFTGAIRESKGVRELIQAMPRIVAEFPRARLLVIGRDTIEPLSGTSFKSLLKKLIVPPLIPRIEFGNFIDNRLLPEILSRASVCVFPSHIEAHGIAIIEGMAMGKAVVVSRTGTGLELVEDEISGMLCDPHNPDSIADKVINLLRDSQLRRQIGARARLRAVSKFSIETMVGRNLEFYQSAVERRRMGMKE